MGYDVEITRAPWCVGPEHFPITPAEWRALAARREDMELRSDSGGDHGGFIEDPSDRHRNFWLIPGGGQCKNPGDVQLRFMIGIAVELDAWVIGQDGEIYRVDPDGEVRGEWTPPTERWSDIDREPPNWLEADEWSACVAAQGDFRLLTEIEARCPSGLRSIPCPPTPHWMGAPSGRPVPFIHQSASVRFPVSHERVEGYELFPTITDHGAATLARAALIADALGAVVDRWG